MVNRLKKNKKERKIPVLIMLTLDDINYLDKKINKKNKEKNSRCALIRFLISSSKKSNIL